MVETHEKQAGICPWEVLGTGPIGGKKFGRPSPHLTTVGAPARAPGSRPGASGPLSLAYVADPSTQREGLELGNTVEAVGHFHRALPARNQPM